MFGKIRVYHYQQHIKLLKYRSFLLGVKARCAKARRGITNKRGGYGSVLASPNVCGRYFLMPLSPASRTTPANDAVLPAGDQDIRTAVAKWLYWSRGLRLDTLSSGLFGEPAWDLLLDLYIREKSGSRSSVTSACIGSRAPHTTALRHISALCKTNWVSRIPDESDKRRYWLSLTPTAIKKLDRHFDRLAATATFFTAGLHVFE